MITATRLTLERYFRFADLGTSWRSESLAGVTTFVTMAYIIFVNPAILHETGMPVAAVTIATCLCAGFGSILMGALANLPLALAPGMGLNAYFTYTVVKGMGVPWQTALGAVFLSGVLFLALTATGLRQALVAAIPRELHAAVAAGIGLFLAFIGLRTAGIIVPSAATALTLGDLRAPPAALACLGILILATLQALRVRAAMLLGVLATMAAGVLAHQVTWHPAHLDLRDLAATAFHLDLRGALRLRAVEIIVVFLFVDLFDNIGTLVAVTDRAGLIAPPTAAHPEGSIPRLHRIFFADAGATILGSLLGTSTVTSYIESAAGVAAGGRSGVTAIITGLLFLASLVLVPLVGTIPTFATAPALVLVGALMVGSASRIPWDEPRVAVPAFLTLITIPFTSSIATGLSLGLISFALLELATGHATRRHLPLYLLAALFLARLALVRA